MPSSNRAHTRAQTIRPTAWGFVKDPMRLPLCVAWSLVACGGGSATGTAEKANAAGGNPAQQGGQSTSISAPQSPSLGAAHEVSYAGRTSDSTGNSLGGSHPGNSGGQVSSTIANPSFSGAGGKVLDVTGGASTGGNRSSTWLGHGGNNGNSGASSGGMGGMPISLPRTGTQGDASGGATLISVIIGGASVGGSLGRGGSGGVVASAGGPNVPKGGASGSFGSVGRAGNTSSGVLQRPGHVACGEFDCAVGDSGMCCHDKLLDSAQCATGGICASSELSVDYLQCDSAADCDFSGGICCFEENASAYRRATCFGSCGGTLQLCDPNQSGECRKGTCQPAPSSVGLPQGFSVCR